MLWIDYAFSQNVGDIRLSVTDTINRHVSCPYVILVVCFYTIGLSLRLRLADSLLVRFQVTALHLSSDIGREIHLVE